MTPQSRREPTVSELRKVIDRLRETQVRPDGDGNIRFKIIPGKQFWEPFDERDSWLGGVKPVGGA